MEILGRILEILDTKMAVPQMYGGFHLFFFIASIAAGAALCIRYKDPDEAFVRKLLRGVSVMVILFEIYKQINFSFHYDGQQIHFDYQWYAFPFQFCSTPMYVGLIAGMTKNRKLHGALCAYLSTYAVFAGLVVMIYPPQVFVGTVGINIQTMVCHGVMITVGMYLMHTGYVKSDLSAMGRAFPVFLTVVTMAVLMNEAAFRSGLLETETFNMFQFSPYCPPSLPVYSLVQQLLPFPACITIYVLCFTIAADLVRRIFQLAAWTTRHSNLRHALSAS